MIQNNEIIVLVLGLGLLIFLFANLTRLRRIPESKLFISAYCAHLMGWVFTVLEGFFWNTALNFIEHGCYMLSTLLMAVWVWRVFKWGKEKRHAGNRFF